MPKRLKSSSTDSQPPPPPMPKLLHHHQHLATSAYQSFISSPKASHISMPKRLKSSSTDSQTPPCQNFSIITNSFPHPYTKASTSSPTASHIRIPKLYIITNSFLHPHATELSLLFHQLEPCTTSVGFYCCYHSANLLFVEIYTLHSWKSFKNYNLPVVTFDKTIKTKSQLLKHYTQLKLQDQLRCRGNRRCLRNVKKYKTVTNLNSRTMD